MKKLALLLSAIPLAACASIALLGLNSAAAAQTTAAQTWTKLSLAPHFLTEAIAGRMDYNPVFSPDGSRILFSRTLDARSYDTDNQLYTVPVTGGEPQRLSHDPLDIGQTRPSWSPQNNQIAFTGCKKAFRGALCVVWIIDENGMNAHPVTATGTSSHLFYPSWYPDGQHVAVMNEGDLAIHLLDVSSGATTALTDRRLLAGMPAVSPDGKWLAIAGQKNDGQRYDQNRNIIWLKDPEGNFESAEANPGQGRAPAWSPDNSSVIFESNRGSPDPNNYAIFVIKRDGTGLTQVTDYALDAQHPTWSRDGREIVFAYHYPSTPGGSGIAVIDYPKP